MQDAIGMLETKGLVALIEATDAMAKAANQNIMINERVKGKANISISEAPWDQVFIGILRTHGLTYTWEGNIIRIMTIEDMEQDLKRSSQKKVTGLFNHL